MLKFLTHKLRTHSLNEDQLDQYKADDDHDSGTESDDEHSHPEDPESIMESETERSSGSTVSPDPYVSSAAACSPASPFFPDSALPSDSDHNYDHHSSEEELEVINSSSKCSVKTSSKQLTSNRSGSVIVPEKRKWSQVTGGGSGTSHCERVMITTTSGATVDITYHSSGSSDEEVQGLLAAMATPVQFRSSPPSDAHKPGHRSLSPPPKLFHYGGHSSTTATLQASPRKRHRHTPRAHHIQRPCLDFEKMQQLKARAVTAWRHSSDHGGELSVFCW